MKVKNIKLAISTLCMCIMCITSNKIYGISEDFKFVIDTIGIPRYNVYGKEINEEVYKAYNIFSYGWPEELGADIGQRWKGSKYGLWAQGIGEYTGSGTRGEYNLLGKDYSGNIINNYYFPVDFIPTDTPEYWEYCVNPGAIESWNDKNKYKYVEQLEYMKNTKLLFNDISSRDNADNPDMMREYNIRASQIGLDKARLDVCSTWKTNGMIYVKRRVGNSTRYAVFLTNPMASDAKIKAYIDNVRLSMTMYKKQDEIRIPISYGANIENMNGYAKKEHIKEIKSELYINGKVVDEISGSKIDTVGKKYVLKLSREELNENEYNIIEIKNKSYAHTEFAVDGLMQSSKTITIRVFVEKKEDIPFNFDSVKVLEKENDNLVVRPLAQFNSSEESFGITEAGKYLAVKFNINDKLKYEDLQDIALYLNDERIDSFETKRSDNSNACCVIFRIPTYTDSTIFGWKSLRQLYGNYFSIDETQIGKRINNAHEFVIKVKYNDKEYSVSCNFDTIDDYVTNINYRYDGAKNNNEMVLFSEWLEE